MSPSTLPIPKPALRYDPFMMLRFDFLENGQKFPSVADWQDVLEKDADGVLSVCRKTGEELPKIDHVRSAFMREKLAAMAEMTRLFNALQAFARQLPRPVGFFSSSEDRKKAYEVSCRFLEGLEPSAAQIGAHDTVFLELVASLREREASLLQAEAVLETVCKAAKRQGMDNVFSVCQEYLEQIGRQRIEKDLFRKELKGIKEELQGFCQRTVPDFCRRITVSADLAGDGKGGSPQGVLQLFGEMRHEVERLLSVLGSQA